MNILFVCKHNRFRSKVAEAYFNKVNKNKKIVADSAGLFPGRPISENLKRIAKSMGLKLEGRPKPITTDLLRRQNVIIIVADNVPRSIFTNKKPEKIVWKINDTTEDNHGEIRKIISQIMDRIDHLNLTKVNKRD
jgi:protein-tyrosine-phosphatase